MGQGQALPHFKSVCDWLEPESEACLAGEELRNYHARSSDESLRLAERCRADVIGVIASEIGPVRQVESLEEEFQTQVLTEGEHLAEARVELEKGCTAPRVVSGDSAVS